MNANQFIKLLKIMKDPDKIAHRIINVAWGFAAAAIAYGGAQFINAVRWW